MESVTVVVDDPDVLLVPVVVIAGAVDVVTVGRLAPAAIASASVVPAVAEGPDVVLPVLLSAAAAAVLSCMAEDVGAVVASICAPALCIYFSGVFRIIEPNAIIWFASSVTVPLSITICCPAAKLPWLATGNVVDPAVTDPCNVVEANGPKLVALLSAC